MVRMRRTKEMMKMQPTTTLHRYLASWIDGGQYDVVVPIGRLHPGTLQCGGVRVVQVSGFPVQFLSRAPLGPPRYCPHAKATAVTGFGAVDQQPASGRGTVVGREWRHSRRSFAGAHIRSTSAGRRRGGVVVRGGRLVGRMVNEALEARLR